MSKCYCSFSLRSHGPLLSLRSVRIHLNHAQLLYLLKILPGLPFGLEATAAAQLNSVEWTLLLKKYLLVAQGIMLGTLKIETL